MTGSLPSQLPGRGTSPGIEAVLMEADWRPRSLVLHVWIIRQTAFLPKAVRTSDLFEPVLSRVLGKEGISGVYALESCLLSLL